MWDAVAPGAQSIETRILVEIISALLPRYQTSTQARGTCQLLEGYGDLWFEEGVATLDHFRPTQLARPFAPNDFGLKFAEGYGIANPSTNLYNTKLSSCFRTSTKHEPHVDTPEVKEHRRCRSYVAGARRLPIQSSVENRRSRSVGARTLRRRRRAAAAGAGDCARHLRSFTNPRRNETSRTLCATLSYDDMRAARQSIEGLN